MKKTPLSIVLLCIVLLSACGGPRKACRKAERHMAKAVYLCPKMLVTTVQHDTVSVVLPGDSAAGVVNYTQAEMDSLSKLCSELVAYAQGRASTARRALEEERQVKRRQRTTPPVVDRLRTTLCELQPVQHADSNLVLKMWTENGQLRYSYTLKARTAKAVVTHATTQVAMTAPCPPAGVSSGWRTYALWMSGFLLLGLIIVVLMVARSFSKWPGGYNTVLVLVLTMGALDAIAQRDSTTGAWMQPRTHDGKLWHDLPPPANVVNAGLFMEHESKMKNSSLLVALIGGAVGGVLYTQNENVGAGVMAASGGTFIYLQWRGNRSNRKAGTFLMSGYQITERYELVPDSVDVGPHMRITPIR